MIKVAFVALFSYSFSNFHNLGFIMLKGIITLLLFQFLGECAVRLLNLFIPGQVVGMILLLAFLLIRGKSFHALDTAVFFHLKYLPLLIIPAATGIITQFETISKEFWAIIISLIFGTIIALAFSAKLMDMLVLRKDTQV
jgi:putative effector of murein hydrolase LrgA (UPF0299 family)